MPTPETAGNDAQSPSEALAQRWLDALLPLAAVQGWGSGTLAEAARTAGLSEAEQALAAPEGADSLIEAFLARGNATMEAALARTAGEPMRTRDRVALAILSWLEPLQPHKAALRRAIGRGTLPWQMPRALVRTWQLADAVWTAAGDTATDYNRYTKRGLLALTLPPVVLYWLQSEDEAAVRAFVERRLDGAMQAGRMAGGAMASVLSAFGRRQPAP